MNPVFLKRFLIVLYASGLIGMHVPAVSATFISLVPLTLWFTGFICFWYFPKPSIQAYILLAAIAVVAWMLEVAGVRTGQIFGEYAYGRTLGYQVIHVPITIGINWILLVMVTGAVVAEWNVGGKIGRAALGAGLMTALDVLIEPVAVHFDFWQWNNNNIPVQNFIAWWVASFFFHWVYISADLPAKSSLFRLIAALQFLFFLGHWILMQINL
ncbi:carotenoid biosynthesis protein [Aquirufa sp. OSTEICH-129V]|uniref:Carotenoid biosynthesis protein n=1 Tax=Aquirufa avitistagni TaxID=3104728 RepID=A0ABW6DDR8_9BACT